MPDPRRYCRSKERPLQDIWREWPQLGGKPRFAPRRVPVSMSSRVSQIVHHPKSMEGPPMPFRKSPSMDRTGVERMAEGWGKVIARRVHEEVGPDLDLAADD